MTRLLMLALLSSAAFAEGRHHTVAHEILDLESAVAEVPPASIELLDSILDEAQGLRATVSSAAEARAVLGKIDRLLKQRGFVVPKGETVELLRDTLAETQTNAAETPRHFFGSDTGSFLYMAIAEVAGLPLVLMERPGADGPDSFELAHYFIRYPLAGSAYDWDVLSGDTQQGIDHSFALDRTMTLGYVHWARGKIWQRLGSYSRATADFREAAAGFPGKAGIANSLAWLLATCPDPSYRDGSAAVGYAQTACALAPHCPSFHETLAAALAAAARFDEAEAAEREVLKHMGSSNRRDEYRSRAQRYHDHQPYLAARRGEQLARDYRDQFSDGSR